MPAMVPRITPGLKDVGARKLLFPFVFEIVLEKRKLDVLAEVVAGLLTEVDIAQVLSLIAVPLAVRPRALDSTLPGRADRGSAPRGGNRGLNRGRR